jgi:hypothetical protein
VKYVELDTPALLLDQDVLEANIAAMAGFFSWSGGEPPGTREDPQVSGDRLSSD